MRYCLSSSETCQLTCDRPLRTAAADQMLITVPQKIEACHAIRLLFIFLSVPIRPHSPSFLFLKMCSVQSYMPVKAVIKLRPTA